MMNSLEGWLAKVYKGTPELSLPAKKSIISIWPWVALVFGILQLLAALSLWRAGHNLSKALDTFNSIYGNSASGITHLNGFYWISLIVLVIDGLILVSAFPKLRVRAKSGWNLLFYGALLDLVYGILSAFNNYGGASTLVLQFLVTAVILYFLFQIRDQFMKSSRAK